MSFFTVSFSQFAPSRFSGVHLPKGPFRTKNAMAPKTVVFYYCRSVYYAYWFAATFPKKNSLFRPFAVVNRYGRSDLVSP